MPISHTTKWHHVEDAKISALTADPAGGSATYGTPIDVPGIKEVGVTTSFRNQELRGDNQKLDEQAQLQAITLTWRQAKISLDALSAMLGGTTTDTGTGTAEVATYRQLGTTAPGYFKFEAKTAGVDTIGGDGHLVFYKCALSGLDLGFAEEDYRLFGGSARTAPRLADNFWFDIVLNETLAAIA